MGENEDLCMSSHSLLLPNISYYTLAILKLWSVNGFGERLRDLKCSAIYFDLPSLLYSRKQQTTVKLEIEYKWR